MGCLQQAGSGVKGDVSDLSRPSLVIRTIYVAAGLNIPSATNVYQSAAENSPQQMFPSVECLLKDIKDFKD